MKTIPRYKNQGVATLQLIALVSFGLIAAMGVVFKATQGAQKNQHAQHTVTQAEMLAWTGVSLLSKAVALTPVNATFNAGQAVRFTGAPAGLSAVYVEKMDNLHIFDVIGASAGAKSVLRIALKPTAASSNPPRDVRTPGGMTLRGDTELKGNVTFESSGSANLYVLDGDLTMQGSVSGLKEVCATGDISIGSNINVTNVCANGDVTFQGSASVTNVKARGNVMFEGGATKSIGTVLANGEVVISGGGANVSEIKSTGNVRVGNGNARADKIYTQGNIDWLSSNTASILSANGSVMYDGPSANIVNTEISAIGNVELSSAGNVRTKGSTKLSGNWGQGISGTLNGMGQLSWDSRGAVVKNGTVGSVSGNRPETIQVTILPGHTVDIPVITIPVVEEFSPPTVTVDAYPLQPKANFSFIGVDSSDNPRVKVANVAGVTDGDYVIAQKKVGGNKYHNYLCSEANNKECVVPLIKVCQGYSDHNSCFSWSNKVWKIAGKTMLPGVLWFEGNLEIGNGNWVNTFLATGDITTSGAIKVYSPNYVGSEYVCQGLQTILTQPSVESTVTFAAWSTHGLSVQNYPAQLCSGDPLMLNGDSIGNIGLLAGGFSNGTAVGGNISVGSQAEVYGAVMAGQYLKTGGHATIAGSVISAEQGGSQARQDKNSAGGSTTIKLNGGSSAYDPEVVPCMANCPASSTSNKNIVWVSPA